MRWLNNKDKEKETGHREEEVSGKEPH